MVDRFGKEVEAAKKMISSLASYQMYEDHLGCNDESSEETYMYQPHQKILKQSLHMPTTARKGSHVKKGHEVQDSRNTTLQYLITFPDKEGNDMRNTISSTLKQIKRVKGNARANSDKTALKM